MSQLKQDSRKSAPLIEIQDLKVAFPVDRSVGEILTGKPREYVKAVDGVSFSIRKGETVALVGESGCGKTTLGRAIVGLTKPTAGCVTYRGSDVTLARTEAERKARCREMQFIFQDPFSSLNPRMRVVDLVGRPIEIHENVTKEEKEARVATLLQQVGLDPAVMYRYPHEFSGGQKQRISVARALAVSPEVIVADEPTAALDVSVQCQILNLLIDLREQLDLTMLFISHDLDVVRYISDYIAVMYLGKLVEYGPTEEVFKNPSHCYTRALLAAIPGQVTDRHTRVKLQGSIGNPVRPPSGCRLHPRCPMATERCSQEIPALHDIGNGHCIACHHCHHL